MPLLTLAATATFVKGARMNRRFLFATGIPLMVAIVAVWGIPALVRTNGEFFDVGIGKHVVARSVVAMEGHGARSLGAYVGSLPFYFVAIFLTFLPWSIKLPWLAKKLWRNRTPLDNYLLAGIAVVFVTFTLVKTKLPHYTLPAYPLLAILLARTLAVSPGSERFVRRAGVGAAVVGVIIGMSAPLAANVSPSVQLVRKARPDLTPEMEFCAADYKEPSLVWYFRKYVDGWMSDVDDDSVRPFMEKPGARFAVLPTAMAAELYPSIPAGWKTHSVEGINFAKLKWVKLTLILKPADAL
jgi:hypothetical protein